VGEDGLGALQLGGSDEGPDLQLAPIHSDSPELVKIRQGYEVARLLRASSQIDQDIRSPGKRDRV
jgi:hypothetical protein